MADSLNVYLKWLGIPLHQQPPNSYRLLGIELFESDLDIIAHAADRQMAHVRTLSAGEHAALAQRLLNEIAAARLQLLNPQKKAAYDVQLQADLVGQQALASAAVAGPPHAALPNVDTELDEPIQPVWQNPLVLATAGICLVMVVGICSLLYIQNRPGSEDQLTQSDPTLPPEKELSPGELAAIPVEGDTVIAPQPVENPPSEAPPAEVPSAKTDPPTTTTPANTPAEKTPPATTTTPPKTSPPTQTDPATNPPADDPTTTVAKIDPQLPEDAADRNAFTPEDPGPPEPIDDGQPIVKKRERLPVPSTEDQARALAEVKQIFSEEYANAKTLEQKREHARFLMRQADSVQEDPLSHYVLLSECLIYIKEGGDLDFTLRTIDLLDRYFVVDALDMKIDVMSDYSKQAKNATQRQIIANLAVTLAEAAAKAHRFDVADKLVVQAQSLAQRAGDAKLRLSARDLGNDIKRRKIEWGVVQTAIDKLSQTPSDAAANLIYGKYLCLEERDWAAGLAHLAQSSDLKLKAAAKQDLAEPSDPTAQIALADVWHEIAQSDEALSGFGYREHYWYLLALPETTGLTRTKVEKRLRENTLVPFRQRWLSTPSSADRGN